MNPRTAFLRDIARNRCSRTAPSLHPPGPRSDMNPLDERGRYRLVLRLLSQALVILSDLAAHPGGRLLRKAADGHGKHLFAASEVGGKAVWVCLALAWLIRTVRSLMPADVCPCGTGCAVCHNAGYLPEGEVQLLDGYTELAAGPALDVWGWVRVNGVGGAEVGESEPDEPDEPDDEVSAQRTFLELLGDKE